MYTIHRQLPTHKHAVFWRRHKSATDAKRSVNLVIRMYPDARITCRHTTEGTIRNLREWCETGRISPDFEKSAAYNS